MILIADSGSTKTSWCFAGKNSNIDYFSTTGINPFFRTSEDIFSELQSDLKPKISGDVNQIYFYGAGIVNEERGAIIKSALERLFPVAEIEVSSDLLAAARATLQSKSGIACILGTGSNSCLFDGEKIISHIPPLGYILGDEGSGNAMGRKLVADYLRNVMPDEVAQNFHRRFPLEYPEFLNSIYRNENVRMFLSGLAPFLADNLNHEYCREIVYSTFEEFMERIVTRYPDYKKHPVCFVGSVAFYFRELLEEILERYSIIPGTIVKNPLEGLISYHG